MVNLETKQLLAASEFSKACGIPLSEIIGFLESRIAKDAKKRKNEETYAARRSARASARLQDYIQRKEELASIESSSPFDIPKSIMEAHADAFSGA